MKASEGNDVHDLGAASDSAWRARVVCALAALPFLANALAWRTQTFSEAGRVPIGYDAFFHARRALQWSQGGIQSFDTSIHAPEGSWLVWPWAWDTLLGLLTKASWALGLDSLELALAAPVVLGVVNLALLSKLAIRLGSSRLMAAVAVLGVGLSPSFLMTHAFGSIDHHALELTVVVSALVLLIWVSTSRSNLSAVSLGGVLGFSHAVHPGLFIWHLPLIVAALVQWGHNDSWPRRITLMIALGLVVGAMLAALPEDAVWAGLFQFDVLSLFHLYLTLLTATGLVVVALVRPKWRHIAALAPLAIFAAIPLVREVDEGLRWLSGDLEFFEQLTETASIVEYAQQKGWRGIAWFYGAILIVGACATAWYLAIGRRSTPCGTAMSVAIALVAALGMSQVRYAYILVPMLWVLTAVLVSKLQASSTRSTSRFIVVLPVVACLMIPLPIQPKKTSIGGDNLFASSQTFWPHLARHCSEGRPVLLAEPVFGHFINYFSECRTIANNFVSNPLHESKIRLAYSLLRGKPDDLELRAPFVDLVLVRSNPVGRKGVDFCGATQLGAKLICDEGVPGFKLLAEIRGAQQDGRSQRLLGLFRVERSPASAQTGR